MYISGLEMCVTVSCNIKIVPEPARPTIAVQSLLDVSLPCLLIDYCDRGIWQGSVPILVEMRCSFRNKQ